MRRHEHWVVVKGRARVTKGRKVYCVDANESTPLSRWAMPIVWKTLLILP